MKITLHVGPHKTGTTSLQSWMHENTTHHLQKYGVYYPPVEEFPPGHAVIAWDTLGIHGRPADPETLRRIVDEAAERGATHLVLSSEEFCKGLSTGALTNLRVLNDYGPLELVVTLTPLPDRFSSEIAEEIKHAVAFDLWKVDIPSFCLHRPGLRPDLVHELRAGIQPIQTHVILAQKNQPAIIFEALAQILGIPGPEEIVEENPRNSDARTRLLNFVNAQLMDITVQQRRELSVKLEAVLQAEELSEKVRPIHFPESVTRFLTQMWSLQCNHLRAMDRNGDIRLHAGTPRESVEST